MIRLLKVSDEFYISSRQNLKKEKHYYFNSTRTNLVFFTPL